MCYSLHLGPVFQVILCLFSGEVNPRLYFAKDGQQYICARLLSIKAMIVKIYGFASYHRRFGVVLLRVRFIAPLWKRLLIVFDIIQLDRRFIDIDAYQVFLWLRLGRLRNVSRSVAWSGITIDWARPSLSTTSSSTRRIKIITSTMSQKVVGE